MVTGKHCRPLQLQQRAGAALWQQCRGAVPRRSAAASMPRQQRQQQCRGSNAAAAMPRQQLRGCSLLCTGSSKHGEGIHRLRTQTLCRPLQQQQRAGTVPRQQCHGSSARRSAAADGTPKTARSSICKCDLPNFVHIDRHIQSKGHMRNGARAEVIAVKIMSCRKMQVACDIVGWLHTEVDMVAFANSYMTLTERRIKNAESMHEFEIIAGLAVRVGWSRIAFSELISKLHSAENLRELQAACEVAARFDKGADFLARSHGGASALASAKRRLQHVELLASLESNDPAVIKQAIAQAERGGLPQATLSAARERLNFLCLSQ